MKILLLYYNIDVVRRDARLSALYHPPELHHLLPGLGVLLLPLRAEPVDGGQVVCVPLQQWECCLLEGLSLVARAETDGGEGRRGALVLVPHRHGGLLQQVLLHLHAHLRGEQQRQQEHGGA